MVPVFDIDLSKWEEEKEEGSSRSRAATKLRVFLQNTGIHRLRRKRGSLGDLALHKSLPNKPASRNNKTVHHKRDPKDDEILELKAELEIEREWVEYYREKKEEAEKQTKALREQLHELQKL